MFLKGNTDSRLGYWLFTILCHGTLIFSLSASLLLEYLRVQSVMYFFNHFQWNNLCAQCCCHVVSWTDVPVFRISWYNSKFIVPSIIAGCPGQDAAKWAQTMILLPLFHRWDKALVLKFSVFLSGNMFLI